MQGKCSYSIDMKYKSIETEKHQLQPETEKKPITDFSKPESIQCHTALPCHVC